MKKYKELRESLMSRPAPVDSAPATDPVREAYIEEKIFNVGDKVNYKNEIAEIISRGPNYLTLIKEGVTTKAWLTDVSPIQQEPTNKRSSQIYKETFIIKGYKTKNFSRELAEQFKQITQQNKDIYAVFNSVVCLDKLLGMTENALKESFNDYKVAFDRANKYFKKFNVQINEMSDIEDALLAHSLEERVKFTAADQSKVAAIIANTAGTPEQSSPTNTVETAARKFKSGSHTPEAWKIIGQMFLKAEQAGIKWDKNIFAKSTLKFMGITE